MSPTRRVLQFALPILVILLGVGIRMVLVATKPVPQRVERVDRGALVEVSEAQRADHEVTLTVHGTVIPAQRVVLMPQVGGRVTWISPDLAPGGRFRVGDELVRIDPRDYRLAVEQRAADLSRSRLERRVESTRQEVAEREWELFDDGSRDISPEGRALALREPQMENANVNVRAAGSAVRRARLDLQRTGISAPFNGFVQAENVDLGQVVGPSSQVVTLVGTDAFWVRVSVPVANLAHVSVPGFNAEEGSRAVVIQQIGEQTVERHGRVVRLYGDLDPAGQMARLLVEIEDPFGYEGETSGLPLLLGSYVAIDIEATPVTDAVEVPRYAVRDGDHVYVMSDDDTLSIRPIHVAWRLEDTVLVSDGIENGDMIITSRLSNAVTGNRLRVQEPSEGPAGPARAEAAP
ncbi:MAG: hypothetical protein DRJ42_05640 [Deltaproteobacteria bacterium]|nr:MAG: hypothetical protein DRJ42_05640 [Deltaproteobacteria bacterium]